VIHLTIEGSARRLLGRREATIDQLLGTLSSCVVGLALVGLAASVLLSSIGGAALLNGAPVRIGLAASLSIPVCLQPRWRVTSCCRGAGSGPMP